MSEHGSDVGQLVIRTDVLVWHYRGPYGEELDHMAAQPWLFSCSFTSTIPRTPPPISSASFCIRSHCQLAGVVQRLRVLLRARRSGRFA